MNAAPLKTPKRLEETLPSPRALDVLALSYRSLVADYYWLKSLSQFGDKRMERGNYPNLIALMRRVVHLDPKFKDAYHFAGTALTVQQLDPKPSIEILERGKRELPNDWRVAFLLGFNRYYFEHDYLGGAQALADAAKLPGAPSYTGALATRLTAEANAPEVGLAMLNTLEQGVTDETLKATYAERRKLLTLELQLKVMNEAVRTFQARHNAPPASLQALVAEQLIPFVPEEPLGGSFYLAEGVVKTTNDEARLRLLDKPGAKP